MKKKIYIAGKVTGLPQQEVVDKFAKAQNLLEDSGFEVINPTVLITDYDTPWDLAMKLCVKALMDCQCIYLLADWRSSKGANIERNLACLLDIEIIEATIPHQSFAR
jgi:hypothetical protein